MQTSIFLIAVLVASGPAAEEPVVEARLEEAAAAAATLERVLAERPRVGVPPCPEGNCRPGRRGRRQTPQEPEAPGDDAAQRGDEQGGDGMRGMDKMYPGGVGSMGGMHEPKATVAAPDEPPASSTPGANRVDVEPVASSEMDDTDDPASAQDIPTP